MPNELSSFLSLLLYISLFIILPITLGTTSDSSSLEGERQSSLSLTSLDVKEKGKTITANHQPINVSFMQKNQKIKEDSKYIFKEERLESDAATSASTFTSISDSSSASDITIVMHDMSIIKSNPEKNNKTFNTKRFNMIKGILVSAIPEAIICIIGIYDHDKSLDSLYNKVMNAIGITKEYRELFNFHDEYFTFNLGQLASSSLSLLFKMEQQQEESEQLHDSTFFHDLSRLLFKWMIYMKHNPTETGKKMSERTIQRRSKSIISFVRSRINLPFNFYLKSMDSDTIFTFKHLMNCEFIENPNIFYLFRSILDDIYRKRTITSCKDLENEYFWGSFDNNLLLKFMIIFYDPLGEIRRVCFPHLINYFLDEEEFALRRPLPEINDAFLENLASRGPTSLGIIPSFVNISIIEFFIEHDRSICACNSSNLAILLRELKEMGGLKREILTIIIGFCRNKCSRWYDVFKRLLNRAFKSKKISLDLYHDCIRIFEPNSPILEKFNKRRSH